MAGETVRDCWQLFQSALSFETVQQIIACGEAESAEQATVSAEAHVDKKVRRSIVRWVQDQWVRDKLWEFVKQANINAFGVDVMNVAELQFTEYHATESGHYDWHQDVSWSADGNFSPNADRKISITVQLSDPSEYTGGDFEFDECPTPNDAKPKGTVLVFPSYLRHRVLPVTSGTRKSMVAWFYGPRWR